MSEKPREWWVNCYPAHYPHWHFYKSEKEADEALNGHGHIRYHFIEKSAIEALEKENKKYREVLIERLLELQQDWKDELNKNSNYMVLMIMGEIDGIKWAIEALEREDE